MTPLLESDLSAFSAGAPALRQRLLSWWEHHGRHSIPWKRLPANRRAEPGEDLDPYPIWVAEVMLQQTQLQVVLPLLAALDAGFPHVDRVGGC